MHESKSVKLPNSIFSDRRAFTVDYTYHGDLIIGINEDLGKNDFLFAHGNEVTLVASMIGYLARIGRPKSEIVSEITDSGKEILEEYEKFSYRRTPINRHSLRHIASGEIFGRFNNLKMGWDTLCVPIPKQPGVLEKVGGTGIYTRDDVFGIKSLLLADLPSKTARYFNNEDSKNRTSELYEADIPPAIKLICDTAMGDYRTEVGWLLNDFVSQENNFF